MSVILRLILFVVFLILLDLYVYQAVKIALRDWPWLKGLYWILSIGVLIFLGLIAFRFDREAGPHQQLFLAFTGVFILFFVPKLIIAALLLLEDGTRLISGLGNKLTGNGGVSFLPERRRFVGQIALLLAAVPFAGILHGIWKGRYNYRVLRKTLYSPHLPKAFDGLTITQISDIHSGSFANAEKVRHGIDLINAQKSDLLVFTGDLVNNRAEEMEPWLRDFAQLKAPLGKFSILGNHDYGDYTEWPSKAAKEANMKRLFEIHDEMGFSLLRNERRTLEKNGERLQILGVENWGAGGFVKYGDLDKASAGVEDRDFKLLLSHDPSHFEAVVKKYDKRIDLTLSGHTHGMQFGIEIPGWWRWSPVQYRYPKWAGHYRDNERDLYVNRGFGYLAFPGRVGIWPEVTVLELRRG